MIELPEDLNQVDPATVEAGVYQRSAEDADNRDNEFLSKALVVGLGVHLFGKAINRNLYSDILQVVGKGARFLESYSTRGEVSNISRSTVKNVGKYIGNSEVPSLALKDSKARFDSLPFVQDVVESLSIISDPTKQAYKEQAKEQLAKHFRVLAETAPDKNRITVGQILDNPTQFLEQGSKPIQETFEYGVLQKAVDEGLISKKNILDPSVFLQDGKIYDTRIARPSTFFKSLSNVFNPFGLVSSLNSFVGSERTVGTLGPDLATKQHKLFIGGNVFTATDKGLKQTATGKELGTVGDARYIASILREEGPKLPVAAAKDASFFDKAQDFLGVGPKFHEKRGGFFNTTFNFFKNLKAVSTGEAQFYGRPYKFFHDTVYNKLFFGEVSETALESGKEVAKGKFAGLNVSDVKGLTPTTGHVKGLRGWWNRVKAYAGFSPDVAIVNKDAGKAGPVTKHDLYTDFGRSGLDTTEIPLGKQAKELGPTGITVVGTPDYTIRATEYATSSSAIDKIYDFTNYLSIRLNKLASASLLGVGFKPSGNLLANMARVAAVPAMYYAGLQGLQYADYSVGKLVGEKPSNILADYYVEGRIAQQKIREKTGLTDVSRYIEDDLLPGVDSGLLGSAAALLAGISTMEGTGSVGKALGVAGALYAAIGGPDPTQSSASLEREYAGEEKVAIRKGRWWALGYQPFKGGEIDHFAPSWYVRMKQQPYQTNVYGSEDDYWKYGTILPNPNNWFGLRNVIDPYALERRNYYDRPYPITAKMFDEVPVFGPLLSDTIGEIIKPTKTMQADAQSYMVAPSNISDKGVPTNSARSLGIPDVPVSVVKIDRPDNFSDRIDKYANVALSPAGVWKFALELFGVKLDDGYKLADASNMNSVSRWFYDMNLGGFGGETEFIRRFLLSDYGLPSKINQQINPIANTMPRWLPGSLSENEEDRTYFTDFTRGDAYTKIPGGEYRLPGAGYESVNPLHSGISGVYSDVDKFLVLSDIAPFSSAYYKQKSVVEGLQLSPYWQGKVTEAQNQRERKIQKYDFYGPSSSQDAVAQSNRNVLTKTVRSVWTGLATQTLENIPILGAKIFPYRSAYEEYASTVVEGDNFADWKNPIETILRPALYTTVGENPFIAAKRGLQMGMLASSSAGSFLNPFPILKASPVETTLAGAAIGGIGSIIRMAGTGSFEHGWVPPHLEKERETKEYFDYIKYAKSRYLENKAEEQGDTKLANVFRRQAQNTVNYGLTSFRQTGDASKYMMSLSRDDRPFFEAFVNAPTKDRNKILKVVPEHMREVLSSIYGKDTNSGTTNPDQQALDYFEDHKLPEEGWSGWSPSVPMAAIQVRAIDSGINGVSDSMHRFGFYPAQVTEAKIRFPGIDSLDTEITGRTESNIRLSLNNIMRRDNHNFVSHSRQSSSFGPNLNWFAGYLNDSRRNDVMAFMQDVYR